MASQVFDERSTHRSIRLLCTWSSILGKLQFLSNTFHRRKYVLSRRSCDPSGFAMTMPGSPYHFSEVINLWQSWPSQKSQAGGRGAVELAATNNWSEESCHFIWLFVVRTLSWALVMLAEAFLRSEDHSGQCLFWFTQVRGVPWYKIGCREFYKKHKLFLPLVTTSFPLLSPPTCWVFVTLL